MFKQRLTIIIIGLLSIQIANGKELKEKYNETTNVSTKKIEKQKITIQTEKTKEPPQKAKLERLSDKKKKDKK
jgi:hypothetical protein